MLNALTPVSATQMAVLHIITGLNDGGAEATLFRLIRTASNHQHVVVSMMDLGKYGPLLKEKGVVVYTLNMPRGRLTLRGILALVKIIKKTKPNMMQTWMYHADFVGGLVARFMGVPVVWGVHNTVLEDGLSTRSTIWVAKACAWLSAWVPKKIICCADRASKVHIALGYKAFKMCVVPNGYDLHQFKPNETARFELRNKWGVNQKVPVLGMVSRFDPFKDHSNFLNAVAKLRQNGSNIEVVLVGTGMDQTNTALQEIICSSNCGPVRLLGQRNDVPSIMNALDLLVLSSRSEAFPNVLAEAMACGTPCVSTNVGDAAQIIGPTGWVVPPQSPSDLANAISGALNEHREAPNVWSLRKKNARQRVCDLFGIEKMATGYTRVWLECVERD